MAINFTPLATDFELKNQDLIARGAAPRGGLTPSPTELQVVPPSGENPNPENPEQPPSTAVPEGTYKNISYRDLGKILIYPKNMSEQQDRMEFSVWEYKDRNLASAGQEFVISGVGGSKELYKPVESAPYVFLPITKISDTNSVDWLDDRLNEIQRVAANFSLDLMTPGGDGTSPSNQPNSETAFDPKTMITGSVAGKAIRSFLAGQASQANNLLTRATGSILNNNLELLFNGPQLRQFSFAFDLFAKNGGSNKEKGEAEEIKDIIYFFKSNMATRDNIGELGQLGKSEFSAGVFLNSPYVFKIRYLKGNAKEHQSIGKIKTCALQNCTVDYTPMGTYMTFSDPEATMVMYRLTLQFKELTPIYASDYAADSKHLIGY
jgi:hypothetical protein